MAVKSFRTTKKQIESSLSEINVTPRVDVMLVLLIIFMVTAPMMHSGTGAWNPIPAYTSPGTAGITMSQRIHISGR